MSDSRTSRMRDEGLAFFGAMIAGQSHEVTNVLNIIGELAGLQRDLVQAEERGLPVDLPRIHDIASRIQDQVIRGENTIRNINNFAHTTDLPVAVFDLKEAIARVLFLAERSARLAQVELVSDLPVETTALENNPFCIQQAVFICIDLALRSASDNRRVTVSYTVSEDGAHVRITSADALAEDESGSERLEFLRMLLTDVGGALLEDTGKGLTDTFVLFFPQHRDAEPREGDARSARETSCRG